VPLTGHPHLKLMKILKLDLHGVRHEDARRQTIRFIEENWDQENELEIITGHSQRMKGIVIQVIEEYDLPYNIGRMFDPNGPRIITWT